MLYPYTFKALFDLLVPVRSKNQEPFDAAYEEQGHTLADPETRQTQIALEREIDTQRERQDIVRHEDDDRAQVLVAHTTQRSTARPRDAVRDLECSDIGQDLADQLHHRRFVREQVAERAAGQQHDGHDHHTDRGRKHRTQVGRHLGARRPSSSQQIPDTVGRRDRDTERDRVQDLVRCHDHALSRKRCGAQATRRKRHDLKRNPFGADHQNTGPDELQKRFPVLERCAGVEPAPFGRAINETDVANQQDKHEPVHNRRRDRRPDKAQAEMPHKKIVEREVERRANEKT